MPYRTVLIACLCLGSVYWLISCWGEDASGGNNPVVIVENEQGTPLADDSTEPTLTPTPIENLVQNGNFQQDWNNGWERDTGEVVNGQSVTEVFQTAHADSGQAVRLVHSGASNLGIYQVVPLPTTDATFEARINLQAETTCMGIIRGCTGISGLLIAVYEDEQPEDISVDSGVGQIIWIYAGNYNDDESFPSSSTKNYTFVEPGWQDITINVRQTVINRLPDVNVDAIQSVMIVLFAGTVGECEEGECYAEVQAADIELVPSTE